MCHPDYGLGEARCRSRRLCYPDFISQPAAKFTGLFDFEISGLYNSRLHVTETDFFDAQAKRLPKYGEPMVLPTPASSEDICVLADGSTKPHCKTIEGQFLPLYPARPPPTTDKKHPERVDFTFRLSAGSQPSLTEPKVPEFYLNEKPWQLFHGAMTPILFHILDSPEMLDKPIISQLPIGSVVDLIIENQINDTIPLYKHGDPAWLLGSSSEQHFPGEIVEDAAHSFQAIHGPLNLHNPSIAIVHDLPPLGWSVLRFQVTSKAANRLHSAKLRYFLVIKLPVYARFSYADTFYTAWYDGHYFGGYHGRRPD